MNRVICKSGSLSEASYDFLGHIVFVNFIF